jgi:hypothetical protein
LELASDPELDEDPLSEDPLSEEPDPSEAPEVSDPKTFRFLPFLKSVSYQPPPLSRNPAAEIFFTSVGSLQAGQISRGSSLIFCMVSISWPH